MDDPRQLHLVVDGDDVFRAVPKVLGRPPEGPDERINYQRLLHEAAWTLLGEPRDVQPHYFQRRHDTAAAFYQSLTRMGYELHLSPYDEGWMPVKEAILTHLETLRAVDCDVLYVGGDGYGGRVTRMLRELLDSPATESRRIGVANFKNWGDLADPEFDHFDLVLDIHTMPEHVYDTQPQANQYPPGYPERYSVGESARPALGELIRAAPPPLEPPARMAEMSAPPLERRDLIAADSAEPEPPPVRAAAAVTPPPPQYTGDPRPVLLLIDHENIDWCLGNLIGAEHLNQDTRPEWGSLRRFAEERAAGGPVLIRSFLQHNDAITGFAVYLESEEGFSPVLLEPEVQPDGLRRAVVDEAICKDLAALQPRHCDLYLVSNDGGYMAHLEWLREHGDDRVRRFGVIGFVDEMSALYRQAEWIDVIDLERDLNAFRYPLPRRYMPTLVDQYNADDGLGSFGLDASALAAGDEG